MKTYRYRVILQALSIDMLQACKIMQYLCLYSLLEDQLKSFLEDSNSSSDDDGDCVAKNGHSEKDGKGKKKRQVRKCC